MFSDSCLLHCHNLAQYFKKLYKLFLQIEAIWNLAKLLLPKTYKKYQKYQIPVPECLITPRMDRLEITVSTGAYIKEQPTTIAIWNITFPFSGNSSPTRNLNTLVGFGAVILSSRRWFRKVSLRTDSREIFEGAGMEEFYSK